ncbi:hypothetical protein ABRP17_010485 [Stenotrophomonas sp. WHRI 8082]|uniref:hypothetical protein n=1 Tax=Stenotrophomonas sp. WHRI 8082 TaxID=3162571 RepID=UPI0032F021AE
MKTFARRRLIIHLFFYALFLTGSFTSWAALPNGSSILFVLAWFPACQWITQQLINLLGWENEDQL